MNIPVRTLFICLFLGELLYGLPALAQTPKHVTSESNDSTNANRIHQEPVLAASPERIYSILLSSKEFSACTKKSFNFSANSASIDPVAGGSFSFFDGHIIGRILELVPNERIVEAWRVVDWPAGAYSIAKFELNAEGKSTRIIFDHIGFPEGLKDHLATGWQEHYWDALAKYLGQ